VTHRDSSQQPAARELLSKLMTSAFIDIRATAYSGAHLVEIEGFTDLERIRLLADLFHNVPGEMATAEQSDGDYQRVLDLIWIRNPTFGQAWLRGAIRYHGVDLSSPLLTGWS
jgi:hypothetical protein